MSIFSNKWLILHAYFFTIISTFLLALFCSILYTILPLKTQILPIFANFSLGLAVFFGTFYHSKNTAFFLIRNVFLLTVLYFLTVFILSFFYGEPDSSVLFQKGVLIAATSLVGEIAGKL